MALHAEDAADRVEQLIALTERLTAAIGRDLADFEARRPQDAAPRVEETARLANLYRHESARVRRNPSLIGDAPPAARAELKRATEVFEAMLARHARAVAAAKTVTEGLVQAIAEEIASARAGGAAYGPKGGNAAAASRPLALNKRT